jgi:quinoprotein glucose dehydrogenase
VIGFAQPVGINGQFNRLSAAGLQDNLVADADWAFYGRTPAGDRFSPLSQITPGNVSKLQVAWQTRTGDTMRPGENKGGTDAGHEFNFENTPIKVGDTLYVCTGHSWVVAFDAATGQKKWTFDPKANTEPDVHRERRPIARAASSRPCWTRGSWR